MITASYPKDISDAMRDCILAIFWPKDHIISFLKTNGCTQNDLKCIANYKSAGLSRAKIVDNVFDSIHSRPDGGLGQFRAILQALIRWEHFDPFYFNELKKLDIDKARRAISHLSQLEEIRDAKIREARRITEEKKRQFVDQNKKRKELLSQYLSLFSQDITARQERGYKLEGILREMALIENLEVSDPFKVVGEQIDGSVKLDGEHYILEAKWTDKYAASEALYQFAHKVLGKMYGRGFFVSVNCFTEQAVKVLRLGKSINTILVDGGDLVLVLEEHLTFTQMLQAKVKAAQIQGRIYIDPITMTDKYKE